MRLCITSRQADVEKISKESPIIPYVENLFLIVEQNYFMKQED